MNFFFISTVLLLLGRLDMVTSAKPTKRPSTPRPTKSPSHSPSTSPSDTPTRSPSHSPSASPSHSPSNTPSDAPTRSPSHSPSTSPSHSPSTSPSHSPSTSPSAAPTRSPSQFPSTSPSVAPTSSPSHSPSASPSHSPSTSPSAAPSSSPSHSPSTSPSVAPTTGPSHSPSASPSVAPTSSPSHSPSTSPSVAPTRSPSHSPSTSPSTAPTSSPSHSPSNTPTAAPTSSPSRSPSASPSQSPSTSPSVSPTRSPSHSPSASPSAAPTTNPSHSPSASPSTSPSTSPSAAPTRSPSHSPSTSPSVAPTTGPSHSPSASPSVAPTSSPSHSPSTRPSAPPTSSPSHSPSKGPMVVTKSPSKSPSTGPSHSPSEGSVAGSTKSPSHLPSPSPVVSSTRSPSKAPSKSLVALSTRSPSSVPHTRSSSPAMRPTVRPTSLPTADTCGNEGSCSINPDPHYMTWDNKWYDFQGGCDQYAIDNPVLEVQIRTRPRSWYSTITQLAIRIKATNEIFRVKIDGQYENTIGNSGVGTAKHSVSVHSDGSDHTINLGGTILTSYIKVYVLLSYGISMQAYGCSTYFTGSEGMCGSWNRGDAFLKDGSRFGITGDYEYDKMRSIALAQSWQIPVSSSLLWNPSSKCDPSSSCGQGEVFACEADRRRVQASAGCSRSCADISVPQFREQCERDVKLTGDTTWACAASYVAPVIAVDRVIPSTVTVTVNGKWYVDWKEEHCVQNCDIGLAPSCGGSANKWDRLYGDAATCCKSTLSYKNLDWCEATSLRNLYLGSRRFYVDEKSWKCKQDCASGGPLDTNGDCGGIVSDGWVQLYTTVQDCCKARIGWQNADLCASQVNPSSNGTGKFYVIHHDMKCAKDCPAVHGTPCAGPPSNYAEQLFEDASKCCKEKLPWLSLSKCLAATNGNNSGVVSGSGKWYIDWKHNKCVKDCVGGAPCGGLKESWVEGFVESSDCCKKISWVPANKCHD